MNNALEQSHTGNGQLLARMSDKFGVDAGKLVTTLKHTAFRQKDGEVSNEQLMMLMVVADQHNLNPFLKEIYAFPDRQGIVPVVGVDGWSRIINDRPEMDGLEFTYGPDRQDGHHEWIECTIYRNDRKHPVTVREYWSEVSRETGPWRTHGNRMHRHKALIQCARIAFGFSGIYDPDEAANIRDARMMGEIKVAEPAPAAELPDLPNERMAALQRMVSSGQEAEEVIAMAATKYSVSDEQSESLRALESTDDSGEAA